MSRSLVVNLSNLTQFTAVNLMSDPGYDKGDRKIPQCMDVSLIWQLDDGKTAHNVLHGRYAGSFPGSVAMANAILTGLTTGASWTALKAFISPTPVGLIAVSLRDRNVEDQPLINSSSSGDVGTSPGTPLPNETAVVITLRTAKVGPAFRGRIYVPGWASNALGAGNIVAGGAVTALQNWANTIPTTFTAQGLTFVLGLPHRLAYTSASGKPHAERAATTQDITSQPVKDNHWDTQRRRGLK